MNTLAELYQHLQNIQVFGPSVKHLALAMQITENLLMEEQRSKQQEKSDST